MIVYMVCEKYSTRSLFNLSDIYILDYFMTFYLPKVILKNHINLNSTKMSIGTFADYMQSDCVARSIPF